MAGEVSADTMAQHLLGPHWVQENVVVMPPLRVFYITGPLSDQSNNFHATFNEAEARTTCTALNERHKKMEAAQTKSERTTDR